MLNKRDSLVLEWYSTAHETVDDKVELINAGSMRVSTRDNHWVLSFMVK